MSHDHDHGPDGHEHLHEDPQYEVQEMEEEQVRKLLEEGKLVQVAGPEGEALFIEREAFDEGGGLDISFPVAYNDVDFCLRLRSEGLRIIWTPYAELFHHESATRGSDADGEKLARLKRDVQVMRDRWGETLERDPFHNYNFAPNRPGPVFASPTLVQKPWRQWEASAAGERS